MLIGNGNRFESGTSLAFDKTRYPIIPAKGHTPAPDSAYMEKSPLNIHRRCFEPANSVQTNIFSMYKQATQADICQLPLAVLVRIYRVEAPE